MFGQGASYDAFEKRFRHYRKVADEPRGEAQARGVDIGAPRTPRVPRGRATKSTSSLSAKGKVRVRRVKGMMPRPPRARTRERIRERVRSPSTIAPPNRKPRLSRKTQTATTRAIDMATATSLSRANSSSSNYLHSLVKDVYTFRVPHSARYSENQHRHQQRGPRQALRRRRPPRRTCESFAYFPHQDSPYLDGG